MSIVNLPLQTAESRSSSFQDRLDDSAFRRRLYCLLALLFFVLGWILTGGKALSRHQPINFVIRDAEGYYIYMPTLLLDHDLDFRNQIAINDSIQGMEPRSFESAAGGQRNRWPIGVALTLAPEFIIAHVFALGLHHVTNSASVLPNGYSIPYQLLCTAGAMAMGCWGMILADGMLARALRVRGRSIGLGVLVYWIGTNYAYYFFREPFMAHVISATWVIAVASVCARIIAAARERTFVAWHWPALSGAMAMALICRFSNASLVPLLLITAAFALGAGQLQRILKTLPLILLATAPLVLQFLITWQLTGRGVVTGPRQVGYEPHERFYWTDPALLKTLISSRHGLLFWSPVLIVSLAGIFIYLLRGGWRNAWLVGLTLSALVLWYVNSAWWCWAFGTSFGARAFVDMAAFFIVGLTLAFDQLSIAPRLLRAAAFGFVAVSIAYGYVMMSLYILKVLPRDDYLFPRPGTPPPPGLDSYYRPVSPGNPESTQAKW